MTCIVHDRPVVPRFDDFPASPCPVARRPADEDDPWAEPDWEEWEQAEVEPDDADEWDEPLPGDDDFAGLPDDETWDDEELD